MAFLLTCNNKGCGKSQEAYIDPKTDKVYCSLCEKEITNITHFTKVQMKSMKQYRVKNSTSFAVKCEKCGKHDRPVLSNGDVLCAGCKKPYDNLSLPFKNMLKDKLKDVGKDVA